MKKINWCKWFNLTWIMVCAISSFILGANMEGVAWLFAEFWCWMFFTSEETSEEVIRILGARRNIKDAGEVD